MWIRVTLQLLHVKLHNFFQNHLLHSSSFLHGIWLVWWAAVMLCIFGWIWRLSSMTWKATYLFKKIVSYNYQLRNSKLSHANDKRKLEKTFFNRIRFHALNNFLRNHRIYQQPWPWVTIAIYSIWRSSLLGW